MRALVSGNEGGLVRRSVPTLFGDGLFSEGRARVKYMPTDVAGVTIIDIEPDRDDRGFFSNLFCADEFAEYGLLFQRRADERCL